MFWMPVLPQLKLSLCLCKYWVGLAVHTQYFEHFMRNGVQESKWLLDACTLISEFYFSQCYVLWVIFSFTMMILEINFKLEINGMVIELHILYLRTYYHRNQHNSPECPAIIIDSARQWFPTGWGAPLWCDKNPLWARDIRMSTCELNSSPGCLYREGGLRLCD